MKLSIKKNTVGLDDKNAIFIVHDGTIAALKKESETEAKFLGYIDPNDFQDAFPGKEPDKFATPFLGSNIIMYKEYKVSKTQKYKMIVCLPPQTLEHQYLNNFYKFNVPYLIFVIDAEYNGHTKKYQFFDMQLYFSKIAPESENTQLYHPYLCNITSDCFVCMGTVRIQQQNSLKDLKNEAINTYMMSKGNNDYSCNYNLSNDIYGSRKKKYDYLNNKPLEETLNGLIPKKLLKDIL